MRPGKSNFAAFLGLLAMLLGLAEFASAQLVPASAVVLRRRGNSWDYKVINHMPKPSDPHIADVFMTLYSKASTITNLHAPQGWVAISDRASYIEFKTAGPPTAANTVAPGNSLDGFGFDCSAQASESYASIEGFDTKTNLAGPAEGFLRSQTEVTVPDDTPLGPAPLTVSALSSAHSGLTVINMDEKPDATKRYYILFIARQGHDSFVFGHAFVVWQIYDTSGKLTYQLSAGFEPNLANTPLWKALIGTPGMLQQEFDQEDPVAAFGLEVPAAIFGDTLAASNRWIEGSPAHSWTTSDYNLQSNNCVDYVDTIATAAGLDLSIAPITSKLPSGHIRDLADLAKDLDSSTPEGYHYEGTDWVAQHWGHGSFQFPPPPTGTSNQSYVDNFTGQFRKGYPNGSGVWHFNDGSTVTGDARNGLPEGHDIFKYPDGTSLEGDFTAGKAQGVLKEHVPNGTPPYSADVTMANGKPNGPLTVYFQHATVYLKWDQSGFGNGPGEIKYDDGKDLKGTFKNAKFVSGFMIINGRSYPAYGSPDGTIHYNIPPNPPSQQAPPSNNYEPPPIPPDPDDPNNGPIPWGITPGSPDPGDGLSRNDKNLQLMALKNSITALARTLTTTPTVNRPFVASQIRALKVLETALIENEKSRSKK